MLLHSDIRWLSAGKCAAVFCFKKAHIFRRSIFLKNEVKQNTIDIQEKF